MARGDERVDLRTRTTPRIKAELVEYADRTGQSLNSATCQLLSQALRLERLRHQADNRDDR
jgi:hypothetical protein